MYQEQKGVISVNKYLPDRENQRNEYPCLSGLVLQRLNFTIVTSGRHCATGRYLRDRKSSCCTGRFDTTIKKQLTICCRRQKRKVRLSPYCATEEHD